MKLLRFKKLHALFNEVLFERAKAGAGFATSAAPVAPVAACRAPLGQPGTQRGGPTAALVRKAA